MQNNHSPEYVLAELKSHSSFYENLPFNTGCFLMITNYKLIGNYRQMINSLQGNRCDQLCQDEFAARRKLLYEEMLFQFDKVVLLSSLTETETEHLHLLKSLYQSLLDSINGSEG